MKKQYIYAGISIFGWSTAAVVTKLLLNTGVSNIQLLWVSSFCAFLFLFFVNLFTGKLQQLCAYKPRDLLLSVAIGLPGTFFYYIFYYWGAAQMPASQAFIINYLWPIMSLIFAIIILKEKATLRSILAICLSFFGIGIIMVGNVGDEKSTFLAGAISCILAAVSYGLFTALNRKFSYDKGISMMLNYLIAFLLTTIINAVTNDLFLPGAWQWVGCSWNGVVTMAIASTLWLLALGKGKTGKISNLAYITPFLSISWTFIVLGDDISIYTMLGFVVIILGIVLQLKPLHENKQKA